LKRRLDELAFERASFTLAVLASLSASVRAAWPAMGATFPERWAKIEAASARVVYVLLPCFTAYALLAS
jgi:hypothetical protein